MSFSAVTSKFSVQEMFFILSTGMETVLKELRLADATGKTCAFLGTAQLLPYIVCLVIEAKRVKTLFDESDQVHESQCKAGSQFRQEKEA